MESENIQLRIGFDELERTIREALIVAGLPPNGAATCARVHAESSLDGVYSHGLYRVARFISHVGCGWINPNASAAITDAFGCIEHLDGNFAPGILNALEAMDRATELADSHGMGLVTLKNTNHWMRAGTYARRAADKGLISISWTNSEPCMPAWGGEEPVLGNNPLCIGIPSDSGQHLVLDMAMSLYSYGKLETTSLAGGQLDLPGGFDRDGELTRDPSAILETRRLLPAGLWKGSGLAMALDMAVALLSGGLATADLGRTGKGNTGCSQAFIAIRGEAIGKRADAMIGELRAELRKGKGTAYFPGERTLAVREENLRLGIPVDRRMWEEVRALAKPQIPR